MVFQASETSNLKESNIRSPRLRSQLKATAARVDRYLQNHLPSGGTQPIDDVIPYDLKMVVLMARDGDETATDVLWSFCVPWAQATSAALVGISEGDIDRMMSPAVERTEHRDRFWAAMGVAWVSFSDALHSDQKSRRWDEHGTVNFVDFVGMVFKRDAQRELQKLSNFDTDRTAWGRVRRILQAHAADVDDWRSDAAIDAARASIKASHIRDISLEYFDFVSTLMRGVESLDKPLSDDPDAPTLGDNLTHEIHEEDTAVNSVLVREALETLGERDADIVRRRVMAADPEELKDIAADWNITQQRAGQIVAEALKKLAPLLSDFGALTT